MILLVTDFVGLFYYLLQLSGIEGIHTAPAGLESTCLVLAYGLGKYIYQEKMNRNQESLKEGPLPLLALCNSMAVADIWWLCMA